MRLKRVFVLAALFVIAVGTPARTAVFGPPTLTPSPLDFSAQQLGVPDGRVVTIQNNTDYDITLVSADVTNGAHFATTQPTASDTIHPGQSRTITATFTPTALGHHTATLSVYTTNGTATLALSGVGIAADQRELTFYAEDGDVKLKPKGIPCTEGATRCFIYKAGKKVKLKVKPSEGYVFTGWADACTPAATKKKCKLLMDEDRFASAFFALEP